MGCFLVLLCCSVVSATWMVSLNEGAPKAYDGRRGPRGKREAVTPSYFFPLGDIVPQTDANEGTIAWARENSFTPVPQLSIGLARLNGPGGNIRVSHWHPGVGELSMLTEGRCRVTVMFGTRLETFLLEVGEVFWAPPGTYHYFEKVGDEDFVLVAAFDTATLSTLDVTQPVGVLKQLAPEELASAFGVSEAEALKLFGYPLGATREVFDLPRPDYRFDEGSIGRGPFCFKIGIDQPVAYAGGVSMRWITAPMHPQLTSLSMGVLELQPGAARRVQYSVNAHEFAIVLTGEINAVVAGPGVGERHIGVARYNLVWTPLTYMSALRNAGNTTARVLLVWTQPSPGFTSLSQTFFADPTEVLSTIYRVPTSTFEGWTFDATTPNPPGIDLFGCPNKKSCLRSHAHTRRKK